MIGAGSMAEALISGMVTDHLLEASHIWVTNRSNQERLQELKSTYGVSATYNLQELCRGADAIILAMKPKDALNALVSIKEILEPPTVIISVLAGVSLSSIEKILDKPMAIVRAMPNTSATIGKSATALAGNELVSNEASIMVEKIFQTVGLTKFVKEEQLDAVTGLSGSGPAYIYYLFEALEKGAVDLGLDKELAKDLILQTFLGAAEMLSKTSKSAGQLRKEVTSPGGTTEAGLRVLADMGVEQAFINCINEATAQSKRLGESISKEMEAKVIKR